jgi:hypothetical protein
LHKNRCLPSNADKRLYLLRELMKCKGCGLTYVGTADVGRKAEGLTAKEMRGANVSGGRILNRYYLCNGRNGTYLVRGKTSVLCPSRAIYASRLEALVWRDVEDFLRNPGAVLTQAI